MRGGGAALVERRLAEWTQIAHDGGYDGEITLRCMRHAAGWNRFALDPTTMPVTISQQGIRDLIEFCGTKGFRVELTGGDAQAIWPSADPNEADPSAFQQHLNEVCGAIVDLPNVVLEELNERWKNGRAYGVVSPQWGTIHPLIRASGYYENGSTPWSSSMNRDYVTLHGTRQVDATRWPKTLNDMPVQASVLNTWFGKPVGLNEPYRFDNDTDPEWAARIGLCLAYCAEVCFHSQRGRDGDGFHDAPNQRAAAVRYFAGVRGGLIAAGLYA